MVIVIIKMCCDWNCDDDGDNDDDEDCNSA